MPRVASQFRSRASTAPLATVQLLWRGYGALFLFSFLLVKREGRRVREWGKKEGCKLHQKTFQICIFGLLQKLVITGDARKPQAMEIKIPASTAL